MLPREHFFGWVRAYLNIQEIQPRYFDNSRFVFQGNVHEEETCIVCPFAPLVSLAISRVSRETFWGNSKSPGERRQGLLITRRCPRSSQGRQGKAWTQILPKGIQGSKGKENGGLLAPPGSSWLLLAPPGSSWPLLAPPGSSWPLLAPPSSSLGEPGNHGKPKERHCLGKPRQDRGSQGC